MILKESCKEDKGILGQSLQPRATALAWRSAALSPSDLIFCGRLLKRAIKRKKRNWRHYTRRH